MAEMDRVVLGEGVAPHPDPTQSKCLTDILKRVVHTVKLSNSLPGNPDDYSYHSTFPDFNQNAERTVGFIGNTISSLLSQFGYGTLAEKFGAGGDSLEEEVLFESLTDAVDDLLEKADELIDDAVGLKEHRLTAVNDIPSSGQKNRPVSFFEDKAEKPQKSFLDAVDNLHGIFKPKIGRKPNALVPLNLQVIPGPGGDESYAHPYEEELKQLQYRSWQLQRRDPVPYLPLSSTPCQWVNSEESLTELCESLSKENLFAVDLEHHSYRSYQGFTCLMQVSTRTCDYLIDTLKLRSSMHILNDVFTDTSIVKVFHGAQSDIVWLQKDFGIYVVNMFDTGCAAKTLKLDRLSLAFLLKYYCNVDVDKTYQLADWRVRPLPEEMKRYAQMDTHFLLFIYDNMRNKLLDKGEFALKQVLDSSRRLCLSKYEKPEYEREVLIKRAKSYRGLSDAGQRALVDLWVWRDEVARAEDESEEYVLPKRLLIKLATELPMTTAGVRKLANPIPPLLQERAREVSSVIAQAVKTKLDVTEVKRGKFQAAVVKATSSPLRMEGAELGKQHRRESKGVQLQCLQVKSLGRKRRYAVLEAAVGRNSPAIDFEEDHATKRASLPDRAKLLAAVVSSLAEDTKIFSTSWSLPNSKEKSSEDLPLTIQPVEGEMNESPREMVSPENGEIKTEISAKNAAEEFLRNLEQETSDKLLEGREDSSESDTGDGAVDYSALEARLQGVNQASHRNKLKEDASHFEVILDDEGGLSRAAAKRAKKTKRSRGDRNISFTYK